MYGLTDGGPAGLIYGYLFCWLGYFTVVASMAELVSMSGALFHSFKALLSYTGYPQQVDSTIGHIF